MPATKCARHPEEVEASHVLLLTGLLRTVEILAADLGPKPDGSELELWGHFGRGTTYGFGAHR